MARANRSRFYYNPTNWKPFNTGGSDVPVTPPSDPFQTIYGVNVDGIGGERGITNRLAWFNRVPMARIFYGGNLGGWNSNQEVATAPEKRAQVSFKPTNSFASIASGAYDSIITNYANAVPSDWFIALTMWHEPNSEIQSGAINFTDYKAAWLRISALLWSLPSKNYVVPSPLFSAPKPYGSPAWNNAWMFDFSEMANPNAIWAWDSYGGTKGNGTNPQFYPPVKDALDMGYSLLNSHGWCFEDGHWAITEFGCTRRTTLDPTGSLEAQWHLDYVANCQSRAAKPHHILVFDGSGTGDFDTQNMRDMWKGVIAGSP